MVSVQAEGCAPIVTRVSSWGRSRGARPSNAHTIADGLRVPKAVGDFLMLRAIRESGGTAIAVSDGRWWMGCAGLAASKASARRRRAAPRLAALDALVAAGQIGQDDVVVLFNTGGALKYLEVLGP